MKSTGSTYFDYPDWVKAGLRAIDKVRREFPFVVETVKATPPRPEAVHAMRNGDFARIPLADRAVWIFENSVDADWFRTEFADRLLPVSAGEKKEGAE